MDIQIVQWFQNMGSGFMDVVFGFFYYMLNPLYLMFIPIILYYFFDKRLAYKTVVFYGVTSFFCGTLKEIFMRDRPYIAHPDKVTTRIESQASGASMPSGHAMGSIGLLYPASKQFGWRAKGDKKRIWVFAVSTFVMIMIGLSRVYMGGHYLTDILAGWGFGILIVAGLDFAMKKFKDKFYLYGFFLLPVMVLLIFLLPESDSCAVGLAFTAAMLIGGYLDTHFVKLDINVVWWKRLIRIWVASMGALLLGLAVVSKIFESALGYPLNSAEASVEIKTLGYFLMFFAANAWAYIACPYLFKYIPGWFNKVFKKKNAPECEA